MARKTKPPRWVGWVREISDKGCGLWSYRTYHGRDKEDVRQRVLADYPGGEGISFTVQQFVWGRPDGPTTIGEYGLMVDDEDDFFNGEVIP